MAVMSMHSYWRFPSVPEPAIHSKRYERFRGVDFSADASAVSDSRSPDALNIISDSGGFPEKRLGWRRLKNASAQPFHIEQPVNGLFYFAGESFVAHGGSKLYLWSKDSAPEALTDAQGNICSVTNARSSAFLYNGKLYILTGGEYLVFDGTCVRSVCEQAYIPTTTIAATPAGVGERFQAANMLTPLRRNTFVADGSSTQYHLDDKSIVQVQGVLVNGAATSGYSVDTAAGVVTFNSAPAAPAALGIPNVEITFQSSVPAAEAPLRYADANIEKISLCSIAAYYYNRVFYSGNPQCPNIDFACELNDPTYIPVSSYTAVGSDKSAIMGYLKLGESLAIVKEESAGDAAVYLRTAQMGEHDVIFPLAQGAAGIGAVAKSSFGSLVDDALFLGREGVFAVATQAVNLQRTVQSRSSLVNQRLLREADMQNACCAIWNGYYVLSLNGHCYLADSRQKTSINNITGSFEYEWYFWDNIPARVMLEHRGELFFGTADGEICMLNSDMKNPRGDIQMHAFADDYKIGAGTKQRCAINAYWTTPRDDDGSFMTWKTLLRAGGGIYLKTYTRSGAEIYVITESDFGNRIKSVNAAVFDFSDLDFSDFTFNTMPQNAVSFNFRKRRYRTIQLKVQNDRIDQGFGFYAIERKYVTDALAK